MMRVIQRRVSFLALQFHPYRRRHHRRGACLLAEQP
jgi:hypothetical protein